jgi:hypothetical protein
MLMLIPVAATSSRSQPGRESKVVVPLQPVVVEDPFEQWGLDIIGEINPHSSKKHRYILTTTDYFTRWMELYH